MKYAGRKELFIYLATVILKPRKSVQCDSNAGIVTSWTKYSRVTINASSSSGTSDPTLVVDDNEHTKLISGSCLQNGFASDPELILFHGLCDSNNLCSVSNSSDVYKVTDGDPSIIKINVKLINNYGVHKFNQILLSKLLGI